ncbi:16S rRNA (guanine(527)-N(7))-methyltransferase RsmG [Acetivibrio saccincola]|uniref:Ribosomal RNA small subunit methyltransferase G n=1 Tax=Acetivibrio saccincola TaxID=1677857 RepID=A0A2K9ER36_9FIRM|nr:16S rRNA (guanine(527)-N(7))-methyltransferase RsmG [Acetivibrio saccincola]AUG59111.1 Ribosomal RNA small subunit methyltransferase G [Acetivibrio saccincola]NLW28025.1 16S rRNA (guanine(527)-N(7))-methyltransferase RsmG [Acetivibrio saccincola]PQQ65826.1 16S rRNA (guanine(527)-N(7))-methyltransferase RsmG [Acetivibrio saccincola]HOA97044.1 16S rRNA (guanine(527)-N(7))-methyltransferase RsmG [Acetivibrio saccincola]HQD28938.1 16S rRNA (guanine(527)-N(7))-methyltransferase RsmG [Acetivibrio
MNENELIKLLKDGASEFNINLEKEDIESFFKYKETLLKWNKNINLTAITDDRDIIIKHFIDSISVVPYIGKDLKKVIDVGTGAGFPGIPLKIIKKDLNVTLLDSLEKRTKFLNEVIEKLDLKNIEVIHSRAEDKGVSGDFREKFDLALARAVANLPVLLEYCLPFVKTGGTFIAMKGSDIQEELDNSKKALEILGGEIKDVIKFNLPSTDIKRNIIIIKKFRHTPTKYPRKSGKPSKAPLI